MSDYSMTVSNSFELFGGAQTTKWDEFNWGEAVWGQGTLGVASDFTKIISEALVIIDDVENYVNFYLEYNNNLVMAFETSNETLYNDGWAYEFAAPSTNAENRALTVWTEV
jgi:hypothetical protein